MARRFTRMVLLALALTGCGKSGIGETCSDASGCADNLSCVLYGGRDIVNGNLACVDTKKVCSITCNSDADCASLGSGYICVNDCFKGSCLMGSRSVK